MKWCLIPFLILALIPLRADDAGEWSPVQRGLQARLVVVPHAQTRDWTYEIFVELRNVYENSEGDALDLTVHFSVTQFRLVVTDASGRELPLSPLGDFDGFIPGWTLVLPPRATISFPVGTGGGVTTGKPGRLLRLGVLNEWMIPPTGGPYRLSATFSTEPSPPPKIPGQKVIFLTRPVVHSPDRPYHGWRGTLELPAVTLPEN